MIACDNTGFRCVIDAIVSTASQIQTLGLTQELLADLSGCGVVFVAKLEAGKPTVRLSKVIDVVTALGLTLTLGDLQSKAAHDPELEMF